jgi:ABC-type Fe3+-citrate transport system substrate-binding protein
MSSSDMKKIEKMLEDEKKAEKKIKDFEKILGEMKNLDPKKFHLWLEIYNNAKSDRVCASALFTQAFSQLGSSSADHVTVGPTLVRYLERMTKSNEQLLTLSQIISKEIETSSTVDTDDIFAQIEGKK